MGNKSFILGMVLIIGSLGAIGGCSSASAEEGADITAWIDSVISLEGQIPGQLMVNAPDNNTSDKFVITVTNNTLIFMDSNGDSQATTFASFSEGQELDIWFAGPVMESYPAQVEAFKIAITKDSQSQDLPPRDENQPTINAEISVDEFSIQKHITKQVEITHPGALVVTLGSNPTTGFSWNEDAVIGDLGMLTQIEHKILTQTENENVPPEEGDIVGAAGKEVWVFSTNKPGNTTLDFQYDRPWAGGEKAEWTLELVITIK
ncbi:MAG: protease inhibitor I42 family protein [Dehalococcoidia bacterium]|nr:MAG: protease inhibitor I42 family protein [Dehalococcoidia bacterium]